MIDVILDESGNNSNNNTNTNADQKPDNGLCKVKFGIPRTDISGFGPDTLAYSINIQSTILDRRAGSTNVEDIFCDRVNLEMVAHQMKTTNVRGRVMDFFLSSQLYGIIRNVIPVQVIRYGEALCTRDDLLAAIFDNVKDGKIAYVISEFVIALALKIGFICDKTNITYSMVYPNKPVTVGELSLDLIAQSVFRTAESINVSIKDVGRVSKSVFAKLISDSMRDIGHTLHQASTYQHLFDDIVKGVRTYILSGYEDHVIGEVDPRWTRNSIVMEMATNYTFVKEALDMPIASSITTTNDIHTLTSQAPMAIASLRGSSRYNMVGVQEYLETFGKKTIVDARDRPVYFVGWRNAEIVPVAQNVSVYDDTIMKDAKCVIPGPDIVSKTVATAMPKGRYAEINGHIDGYLDMLENLATTDSDTVFGTDNNSGLVYDSIGEAYILGQDGLSFSRELACMMSSGVSIKQSVDEDSSFQLIYHGTTRHKQFQHSSWYNVVEPGGAFATSDIGVFLLLSDDIIPKTKVEPRSQLISESAMRTRVLGFDTDNDDRFISADKRVTFYLTVANTKYSGNYRVSEVGMRGLPEQSRFVRPVHNSYVVEVINSIQDSMRHAVDKVSQIISGSDLHRDVTAQHVLDTVGTSNLSSSLVELFKFNLFRAILEMSRSMDVNYRNMVTSLIRSRALQGKSHRDVLALRGPMMQGQFYTFADVTSLKTVFATNGLDITFINEALEDVTFSRVMTQYGSDRLDK